MKKFNTLLLFILASKNISFAQVNLKEFNAGHSFSIGLPEYMQRTVGLNSVASIQYKNAVKDVYGFVIVDTKEELNYADLNYANIEEFYEDFIKDFLKDEEKRNITTSISKKIGEINFIECDATYFDKEANTEIYYFVGIVETKKAYYKVLSWATLANKDKFKADFQKSFYSIKD